MGNPTIFKLCGLLLLCFSLTMLPPIVIDWCYQESSGYPFIQSFIVMTLLGSTLWYPFRHTQLELRGRDAFMVVVLFWVALSLIGALPFLLSLEADISLTDAVFESVSGITATGATVLSKLEDLPHSILYYRQQLQFFGGLGILILAVAIIPMLGVGGMQLFRADASGPIKDNKMTPRITETAKGLWIIYILLTLLCGITYVSLGMTPFDALCYAFGTISTGGFAPYDSSFALYNTAALKTASMIFMFLAAVSFPLHFIAIHHRQLQHYWHDEELRSYVFLLGFSFILAILYLSYHPVEFAISDTLFHIVSFSTTTGYMTSNYSVLPGFLPLFLFFLAIIGGCAGSTSGGIKVIRLILLQKQGSREIKRLIHPNGIFSIQYGNTAVSPTITDAVWGFIAVYGVVFCVLLLLLLSTESDFTTAYGALMGTLSNAGPGLGDCVDHYGNLQQSSKWILSLAMIAGRLEIFTLLVFISPQFWRN